MTNSDDSAFAFASIDGTYDVPGLTKREYFAAMALGAISGGRKLSELAEGAFTRKAVKLADALIEALNKE